MKETEFVQMLRQQGRALFRDMPWRRDTRGYYVLVSEIMLQQTQVDRVVPKFEAFVARFPDVTSLAAASLGDVLEAWSGLGYNRRAKFLHKAAKMLVDEYGGELPDSHEQLVRLPGVGVNTAGAILAYTYNKPVVYIETNVRTVYIHHFFADRSGITDAMLRERVEATLDTEHPREFYWALMDYGSWLKRSGVRNNAKGAQYRKQAPLEGSVRQVRGAILKHLVQGDSTVAKLQRVVDVHDGRFERAYELLIDEGLIRQRGTIVGLTR